MAQYSKPLDEVISELHRPSGRKGLYPGAQAEGLREYGPNRLRRLRRRKTIYHGDFWSSSRM